MTIRSIWLGMLWLLLSGFSPTYSHLKSSPSLRVEPKLKSLIFENRSLIHQILKKEQELAADYYIFYHASEKLFFYQELIRELLLAQGLAQSDEFLWLRLPQKKGFASLEELFYQNPSIDDSKDEIRRYLLSVNLSLFGNLENPDCCTLAFWLLGHHVHPRHSQRALISEVLSHFQVKTTNMETLVSLAEKIIDKSLLQILVPKMEKARLDQVFYMSHDKGVRCPHICHLKPSKALERYVESIETMPHLEVLQGRLLLTPSLLLNPASGVRVYRYVSNLSQQELSEVRGEIQKWVLENTQDKKNTLNKN